MHTTCPISVSPPLSHLDFWKDMALTIFNSFEVFIHMWTAQHSQTGRGKSGLLLTKFVRLEIQNKISPIDENLVNTVDLKTFLVLACHILVFRIIWQCNLKRVQYNMTSNYKGFEFTTPQFKMYVISQ